MKKKDRITLAEARAMSLEDLWRGLFESIPTICADADLARYRAMGSLELAQGLRSENPVEAANCKVVLTERMEARGSPDIVYFLYGEQMRSENSPGKLN
jgi:hypothetical protein